MQRPVIIEGRPIHPNYGVSTGSALHAVVHSSPRPLPARLSTSSKTAKYTWLAKNAKVTTVGGKIVKDWPGSPGPVWNTAVPYQPHKASYDGAKVSYDNVINFWWTEVQHMYSFDFYETQPFTFVITGILHGGSSTQDHHILDSSALGGTPFYDTPNGVYGKFSEGTTPRTYLRMREASVKLGAPTVRTGSATLRHKAAIYMAHFEGAKSFVDIKMQGYHRHVSAMNIGTDGVKNTALLLGRQAGRVSPYYASHMSLLEIQFFHGPMTTSEIDEIHEHLFAVYQLDKW